MISNFENLNTFQVSIFQLFNFKFQKKVDSEQSVRQLQILQCPRVRRRRRPLGCPLRVRGEPEPGVRSQEAPDPEAVQGVAGVWSIHRQAQGGRDRRCLEVLAQAVSGPGQNGDAGDDEDNEVAVGGGQHAWRTSQP